MDSGKPNHFPCNARLDGMPTITKTRARGLDWYLTNRGMNITGTELMRCQGFDPDRIHVPEGVAKTKLYEMVGNAYTVNVMEALIRQGLIALGRI